MIEEAFTLYTDLFEVTTPKAHFINDRCFGEDFARWLGQRLEANSLKTPEPIQEDWGWVLLVPFKGNRFTVSIGVMDESIGKIPAEWGVGICFEKPANSIGAWFRKPPHADLHELAQLVEKILRSEPRIQKINAE